ncbi:MAG TPA: aldo/keto reductase [Thermoanaerobaculia bacterium]|nr:aldo/keto reductase [Thermoanaerobaculia bacterium]
MERIRFGRTEVMVPRVSLGTWGHGGPNKSGEISVGWSGHDDEQASGAILTAYESGITHWDTADVYGNGRAERLIGALWDRVPRAGIFLATKTGWDAGRFEHYYHPEQMRKQMEASLRNLSTETVDLYYFHHCDFGPDGEWFDDAMATMLRFREEGKLRFLGLSDWDAGKIMRWIDRVDPDVVQPYRNVIDDDYVSSGLRDRVDAGDLGVAFFSPIKHGLLLGKYHEPIKFPDGDFRNRIPEFSDPEALARINEVATAMRVRFREQPRPALYALVGAVLADAPTGTALLGQRNPEQAAAAANVGTPLTPDDAEWVRQMYKKIDD